MATKQNTTRDEPFVIPGLTRRLKPLIVDKKLRRFWALVEKRDGTLRSANVSADYSDESEEVTLFTSLTIAKRAAAAELLNSDVVVEPVEVFVLGVDRR